MKNAAKDHPLLLCLCLAYLLLFISYLDLSKFWFTYTAAMTLLMILSILIEHPDSQKQPLRNLLLYGSLSGALMYGITWTASKWLPLLYPPLQIQLEDLYRLLSPASAWQYAVLILLIIPGEEIFWRGFVQRRIHGHITTIPSVLLAALLYTLPLVFSGNLLLVLAGIGGGLLWGTLYAWKKNLQMVIISHLLFDLLLLAVFPLQ